MVAAHGSQDKPTAVDAALRELLETYNDLNSATIDELDEEPSALEFMRYVALNRPFVVRRGAQNWAATRKWSAEYILAVVGDSSVNVAVTPYGNADAVVQRPNGKLLFVKPLEQEELFRDVLSYIQDHEKNGDSRPVKYAQTQNDNLRNEYSDLFADVAESVPFARIALQKQPEAINFWLGNSHSVTALHKDNYENVYVQIRGKKHFVLLPPIAAPCVNERLLPAATYVHNSDASDGNVVSVNDLQTEIDKPAFDVPVAIWDPDTPDSWSTDYSPLARPMRVTLDEGDLLYLPALWYHKVSQSCGDDGFCCAINYWYDMEFAGQFWASNAFVRDVVRSLP